MVNGGANADPCVSSRVDRGASGAPSAHDQRARKRRVTRHIASEFVAVELVDMVTFDFDHVETEVTSEGLEAARLPGIRVDLAPIQAVPVEVTMMVPSPSVRAGVATERFARQHDVGVVADTKPEVDTHQPGAVDQKRKVERRTVPRDEHTGGQRLDRMLQIGEQRGLGTVEHDLDTGADDGNADHRRHSWVETVHRCIGFNVEAVERCVDVR